MYKQKHIQLYSKGITYLQIRTLYKLGYTSHRFNNTFEDINTFQEGITVHSFIMSMKKNGRVEEGRKSDSWDTELSYVAGVSAAGTYSELHLYTAVEEKNNVLLLL